MKNKLWFSLQISRIVELFKRLIKPVHKNTTDLSAHEHKYPVIISTTERSSLSKIPAYPQGNPARDNYDYYNQDYPQVCIQASTDYSIFDNFRRNPFYNIVLEHVSEEQGSAYLQIISSDSDVLAAINSFKPNDDYGNPITYEYPNIGAVSPSTLRYIKVLVDIKKYFRTADNLDICEIGVGYGGQCRIINAYYKPATYCLVDMQPVLALAGRFLDNYILHSVLTFKTMNELGRRDYDLFISNYAFTELPRVIQDIYLSKVILNSKRGYITYNEHSPEKFNSYKLDELIAILPPCKILKEEPLTHPKNCIIVWGTDE